MDTILFESTQLNIRRFSPGDHEFVFELLNTPGWKKFIGDRNINTTDDAIAYIVNGPVASYELRGYGLWLAELKSTGQPIGMCGPVNRDYLDSPDLGFAFLPGFEGKGLAYEACMAALSYIKQNYTADSLYAITIPENIRSQRLLERCGFAQNGLITPSGDIPLLLYRLNLQ
ncbi:N-acetyltransferase [Mucilaginibacter terrigena]|uniref:N-acetyltransferase n=1 Tax=Mucilaginibacter terrigena TaxID=2492395 RepID=A0A4Q5LIP8_9SPHI|nr:GNAT family N-acetyltransferase [Mucilaginibacter terrigena]RYU85918.1 N-acetyltransferase [Mucilaginibacter terrigena]